MKIIFRGDLLKYKRKKLKISQSTLAQKLGVSRINVYRWENSLSVPSPEQIGKLLFVLKIDFFDIFKLR